VGPRVGLDAVVRIKYPYPYRESNAGRPVRSLVTIVAGLALIDGIYHRVRIGLYKFGNFPSEQASICPF
jgi:hypothetical protein